VCEAVSRVSSAPVFRSLLHFPQYQSLVFRELCSKALLPSAIILLLLLQNVAGPPFPTHFSEVLRRFAEDKGGQ
jgi:hypothetical protein